MVILVIPTIPVIRMPSDFECKLVVTLNRGVRRGVSKEVEDIYKGVLWVSLPQGVEENGLAGRMKL
jgi:hypothetical protein